MQKEIVSLTDENYTIPVLSIKYGKQFRIFSFAAYFVWDANACCKLLVDIQGNGVVIEDLSDQDSYVGDENLWLHWDKIGDGNPDFCQEHNEDFELDLDEFEEDE